MPGRKRDRKELSEEAGPLQSKQQQDIPLPESRGTSLPSLEHVSNGGLPPMSCTWNLSPIQRSPKLNARSSAQRSPPVSQHTQVRSSAFTSRCTSLLVDLGSSASGLGLALTFEGRRRLRYCITWLQYATARTEYHITTLHEMIADLRSQPGCVMSPIHQQLIHIRRDVAHILRSVIDVANNCASNVLPRYACKIIRQNILSLPLSFADRLACNRSEDAKSSDSHTMDSAQGEEAATLILTLAVELLDIILKVTHVIADVLDRADDWAQRLRLVQSPHQQGPLDSSTALAPGASDASDAPVSQDDLQQTQSASWRWTDPSPHDQSPTVKRWRKSSDHPTAAPSSPSSHTQYS
ncbi:transcriptional regulator opi1 [Malassezia yamatoensis]|uniref:Transcriptional regulator opi1 n=1 Tax=Malassezia yamatoensis TaxID=253288 RepID=A0AAJ6CIS4_9BASI|nr:transcriptional regulator opi1 [Malassezia yamatoensis]